MFCAKCGTQLADGSKFCSKCGASVGKSSAQTQASQTQTMGAMAPTGPQASQPQASQPQVSQPQAAGTAGQVQAAASQTQPQIQPQAGQVVYVQGQSVPQQVYVQPQGGRVVYVQGQSVPQQVYVQPQAGQVVYMQPQGQPGAQQVYVQGQPQGQPQPAQQPAQQQVYVQPQGQPQGQTQPVQQPIQPQVVQPQVQNQGQPQPAPQQAYVQSQAQAGAGQTTVSSGAAAAAAAAPKKKKKGAAGAVIGIIAAVAAVALLIVGAVKFGVFKSPKKLFAENVVGVFENVYAEMPNMGMTPAETLLHLTVDDTKDSHTTTTTTSIQAAEAGAYESLELVQSYSYDEENGNAAYDFSIASGGSTVSTGAVYFNGNEFLFTPMSTSEPMVRYMLDADSASNYKKLGAIDRYALMIRGDSKEAEKDWKEELAKFSAQALKDLDKKQFTKSKEEISLLGKPRKCQVATVNVNNDQAMNLINSIGDMIYSDVEDETQKEKYNLFNELCTGYQQNGGNLELAAKTYSYRGKPAKVILDADLSGVKYCYEITFYAKGKEKEFSLSSTLGDEVTLYEDSALSAGVGQFQYTTKYEDPKNSLLIEKKGIIVGNNREVNGTLTFTPRDGMLGGSVPLQEESITGQINETVLMGNGTLTTIVNNGTREYVIMTEVSRESLQSGKINPPQFLEASGRDCATLEELKAAVKIKEEERVPEINNSLVRLAQIYALFARNGLLESIQDD